MKKKMNFQEWWNQVMICAREDKRAELFVEDGKPLGWLEARTAFEAGKTPQEYSDQIITDFSAYVPPLGSCKPSSLYRSPEDYCQEEQPPEFSI